MCCFNTTLIEGRIVYCCFYTTLVLLQCGHSYRGGVGVGVYLRSIGGVGAKESLLEFHLCHYPIIYIVF